MKEIKRFICLLMIVLLLSGCVKERTTMTIKNDKSVIYSTEVLISNALGEQPSTLLNASKYEKNGFKVTNIKENNYVGYELSKTFSSIEDISTKDNTSVVISDFYNDDFDYSKIFKVEEGFFKNTYTANFKYKVDNTMATNKNEANDLEEEGTTEAEEDDLESLSLMSEMEFKYKVNLPNESISNNASEVTNGGKTLSWNLSRSEESEITFKFSLLNIKNIIIAAGSALLALIIFIIIISLILKKKKAAKETLIHKEYDPSIAPIVGEKEGEIIETIGEEPLTQSNVSAKDSEMISNLPGPAVMQNLEYTLHEQEITTEEITVERTYEEVKPPVQEITPPTVDYNSLPEYVIDSIVDNSPKTFMTDETPVSSQTPTSPESPVIDVPNATAMSDILK